MRRIKKDLFDVLREKVHCEYLSDLKVVNFERVRAHLEQLDKDDFDLKEILDAINWFGGKVHEMTTKEEAWTVLLNLKR